MKTKTLQYNGVKQYNGTSSRLIFYECEVLFQNYFSIMWFSVVVVRSTEIVYGES